MNVPIFFAHRYLISKKSLNIINILSFIAIIGIAFGTAALFIILSVFNGFEDIIYQSTSSFTPELKIELKKGKKFTITDTIIQKLKKNKSIAFYGFVIEENAIAEYKQKQTIITLLGVDQNFNNITGIDSCIYTGEYKITSDKPYYVIVGYNIANELGIASNSIVPLTLWAPSNTKNKNLTLTNAFNSLSAYVSGIFSIQEEYDSKYVISDINTTSDLFNYKNEATAIYIKPFKNVDINKLKNELQLSFGKNFIVKNRYEQNQMLFKMLNTEHWAIFAILTFILFISSFNIIGSIIMLIVEKQKDIATLYSLGATTKLIRKVFLTEGFLISLIGAIIGLFIGISICLIQEKFGIITMPSQGIFIISVYPVKIQLSDIALVFITVISIGYLISLYPISYITNKIFNIQKLTT